MTPLQVAAVQRSFSLVVPIKEQAAQIFYDRLFSVDPSLKKLFKGDMKEQGKKLMSALALVVAGLANPQSILPKVEELGRKHVGYGVEDRHYDTVGGALLWTLEKGLGDKFTPDVKEAWTAAYTLLANVMKGAANKARAVA
jgi:hemoglobin-like flavoprotein